MIGDTVIDGGKEFVVTFDGRQQLLGDYRITAEGFSLRQYSRRHKRHKADRKRHQRMRSKARRRAGVRES